MKQLQDGQQSWLEYLESADDAEWDARCAELAEAIERGEIAGTTSGQFGEAS